MPLGLANFIFFFVEKKASSNNHNFQHRDIYRKLLKIMKTSYNNSKKIGEDNPVERIEIINKLRGIIESL